MQEVSTSLNVFVKFLAFLKDLNLSCDHAQEDDGSITCWTERPHMIENAPTLQEGLNSLIHSLRDRASEYMNDFEYWVRGCPDELPYIMKIMLSNDEELALCLLEARPSI